MIFYYVPPLFSRTLRQKFSNFKFLLQPSLGLTQTSPLQSFLSTYHVSNTLFGGIARKRLKYLDKLNKLPAYKECS